MTNQQFSPPKVVIMLAARALRGTRHVRLGLVTIGLCMLSACGGEDCPPGPSVDLDYLSQQWDTKSPVTTTDGVRCRAFDVDGTGVQVCEYDDTAALTTAVSRGAIQPAGTRLTIDGLDVGVRSAEDRLVALRAKCDADQGR